MYPGQMLDEARQTETDRHAWETEAAPLDWGL